MKKKMTVERMQEACNKVSTGHISGAIKSMEIAVLNHIASADGARRVSLSPEEIRAEDEKIRARVYDLVVIETVRSFRQIIRDYHSLDVQQSTQDKASE